MLVNDSLMTDENVRQHGLSYRAQYNTLERHGFGGESLFAPAEAVDGSVHALQQQSAQMVWKGGETIHLHRARLHIHACIFLLTTHNSLIHLFTDCLIHPI